MDNDIKAQAKKELQRRAAMKELERRKAPIAPDNAPTTPRDFRNDPMSTQFLDGATFGFGDNITSAITAGLVSPFSKKTFGDVYGAEQADKAKAMQYAQENNPKTAAAVNIGGSVLSAGGLAKQGLTLAGRGGTAGMAGLKGLLARSGLMAAEGAGYGALSAAGHGEDLGTGALTGAAGGALGNLAGEGITAGASKVAGLFNKAPKVMSGDELKQAGVDALNRADAQGIMFTPQGMGRLHQNAVSDMTDFGFHPQNQPGAATALSELSRLSGQNVTLKGLHTARKLAKGGFNAQNPSNNEALERIVSRIDETLSNPQAGDVIGNSAAASDEFKTFKDLYARGSKLKKVDKLVENAKLRAGSTGSGGNVDNATRQNLRQLLTNGKLGRGFTADEKAAIEKAVTGTKGQNALRLAGKLSPQGNGLMAALGVGGAMVNPGLGALSLGGMGAKTLADKQTQKAVKHLTDLIAAGGKASALKSPKNAAQKMIENNKQALIRALMMGGLATQAGQP